jgi:putative component of membrane protein insertase Oxa1/YidC/SpoIIIJ protein YidD
MSSNLFLFSENLAMCEIKWKNSRASQGTFDSILSHIRFKCWMPKCTNTHSENVTLIAFTAARMVTRTRLHITLYVHYVLSWLWYSGLWLKSDLVCYTCRRTPMCSFKIVVSLTRLHGVITNQTVTLFREPRCSGLLRGRVLVNSYRRFGGKSIDPVFQGHVVSKRR